MKQFTALLLILILPIVGVFADGPMKGLFAAADQVATDVPRVLPDEGTLLLGGVTQNGMALKLGDLLSDLLANRLSGRSDFGAAVVKQYASPQFPPGQAGWTLSGSLYEAGAGYLMILQLTDAEGSQLKGWEFALSETDVVELLVPSAMASTRGWDAHEPNDDAYSATVVTLPFTADGLTLAGGDEDWFAFEVPESRGDSVFILEAATTGGMDTYMELYSPEDQDWAIAEDDDTDGGNAVIQMPLTTAGTWYVKVRGYSSEEEGSYGLRLSMDEGSLGPGEPDEGTDRATRLNVGTPPVSKRMDYINDADWFRINLVRPLGRNEVLRIETLSGMDLVLELLDEYEGLIMEDDDSGHGNNAMIMAGGLDAGTYYAVVTALGGETGDYEVMVNVMIPVRDSYEDDGSMSSASVITPDGTVQERSFSPVGDQDWVRFEVTREDFYLMRTEGDIDTYMELYDSDGDMMDENDDGDDYNAQIERRLSPGIYYLKIYPYGTASPDDVYRLIVE